MAAGGIPDQERSCEFISNAQLHRPLARGFVYDGEKLSLAALEAQGRRQVVQPRLAEAVRTVSMRRVISGSSATGGSC